MKKHDIKKLLDINVIIVTINNLGLIKHNWADAHEPYFIGIPPGKG